jgi:hypothetical protein
VRQARARDAPDDAAAETGVVSGDAAVTAKLHTVWTTAGDKRAGPRWRIWGRTVARRAIGGIFISVDATISDLTIRFVEPVSGVALGRVGVQSNVAIHRTTIAPGFVAVHRRAITSHGLAVHGRIRVPSAAPRSNVRRALATGFFLFASVETGARFIS